MTEDLKKLCEEVLDTANSSIMSRDFLFNKAQRLAQACLVMMEALKTYAETASIEAPIFETADSKSMMKRIKVQFLDTYRSVAEKALTKANAIARGEE